MISLKTKIILIIVIAVIIVGSFVLFKDEKSNIPMISEYEDKIVYTTDLSVDKSILIEDCSVRGGYFNTCGTPCSVDEVACTSVCAYTCNF